MNTPKETMTVSVFESESTPDRMVLVARDYTQCIVGIFLIERETQEVLDRECVSLSIPEEVLANAVELMFRGRTCTMKN